MKSKSMKLLVVLLALELVLGWAHGQAVNSGEPGCQTEEEIADKYYRHFQNKTLFWECVALGQPAVLRTCPVAYGFLDPKKLCVHFSLWYWTPTVAPPSAPAIASPAEA